MLGERVERPRTCQWEVRPALLEPVVLLAVIRDVLADTLLARSLEVDDRRLPEEVRPRLQRQQLELVTLELQREVPNGGVQAHRSANATDTPPASPALQTASA